MPIALSITMDILSVPMISYSAAAGGGAADAIAAAANVSKSWAMPALMTEFGSSSCDAKVPAEANGIGWSFWEYGNYCNTFPAASCHYDPTAAPGEPGACDFGACITGINGNAAANLTGNNASAQGGSPGGCMY